MRAKKFLMSPKAAGSVVVPGVRLQWEHMQLLVAGSDFQQLSKRLVPECRGPCEPRLAYDHGVQRDRSKSTSTETSFLAGICPR